MHVTLGRCSRLHQSLRRTRTHQRRASAQSGPQILQRLEPFAELWDSVRPVPDLSHSGVFSFRFRWGDLFEVTAQQASVRTAPAGRLLLM